MRNTLTLIALLVTSVANAAQPAGAVVDTSVAFESVEAAATAGEVAAYAASQSKEFAGVIVNIDGKFYISTPVSSGQEGHFSLAIRLTASQHLVALYHSHPSNGSADGIKSQSFSSDDVTVAKTLKVTSYIGVQYDHTLRAFTPGVTHASLGVSDGDVIGKF